MEKVKYLKPREEPIEIGGNMLYSDNQRAWSLIRLKKEIILQFPGLRRKLNKPSYKVMFCKEFKQLEKEIEKAKKDIGIPPLLVWFVKE